MVYYKLEFSWLMGFGMMSMGLRWNGREPGGGVVSVPAATSSTMQQEVNSV